MSSGSAAGTAAVLSMMGASTGSGGGGGSGSLASSSSAASYSNERPGGSGGTITGGLDVEYASDPASGGFFHADYKKHDDLKQMLDSNKDSLKLEAMKRIIAMVAKGRDASDLFPAVVKNVVSKNIEVKKLVYVYLVRYAEEQQDLALLSISTFQRALKDPNQLIRAGALRVLSSIRVSMIVPIVMLAIRDSASDMSPYVRKTAAHAIPKLYSLDAEQKDELIGVIEKLLADRTTLVVGSAVMAFEEVCPERVDLIHKNYRKLCNLLVDVDEWGQIIIINMLTRYARTQFVDPNRDDYDELGDGGDAEAGKPFYDETTTDSDKSVDEEDGANREDEVANGAENGPNKTGAKKSGARKSNAPKSPKKVVYQLDADHRLLLRQTKPLLQSRNASVVMTVAQLYHHVAPRCEVALVAKALIRLLRSHTEVQSVVLTSIASMSTQRHAIFEPYIKSFFVRTSSDPTHVKLLKLEILTNLANAASIGVILREFQQYISSSDKVFVAATIQAIGRCAASIREVTETCLAGLVHLLSNRDEYVVAESVVVIKQLLQTQRADHYEIISQMAKLLDFIAVAAARAAILWLIGEYNEKVPRIAPDVLRKLAKSFVDEENIVKLQVLNLAVKLHLTNAAQTEQLGQYVFSLARYDPHYDVRDRARFLRQFVFPAAGQPTVLSRRAREIFLAAKPAPQLLSKYGGRDQFQLGSLSHYLNVRATGYHEMPAFPEVAPDSGVRHVESPTTTAHSVFPVVQHAAESFAAGKSGISKSAASKKSAGGKKSSSSSAAAAADKKGASFYSESEKSTTSYGSSSSSSSDEGDAEKAAPTASSPAKKPKSPIAAAKNNKVRASSGTSDSEEDSSSSSGSSSSASESGSASASSSSSASGSSSSEDSSSSSDEDDDAQNTSTFSKAQKRATQIATRKLNGDPKPQASTAYATTAKSSAGTTAAKSNLDLLLELDDIAPAGPIMTPSLGGFLTPSLGLPHSLLPNQSSSGSAPRIEPIGPSHIPHERRELLSKLSGNGVAIACRFTRAPHLYSGAFVSVELAITNTLDRPLNSIRLEAATGGATISAAQPPLAGLAAGATVTTVIGIDFGDSTQPVALSVAAEDFAPARCQLRPTVGELVRSVRMTASVFREECGKLRGMNEHQTRVRLPEQVRDVRALRQRVFEYANVAMIADEEEPDAEAVEANGARRRRLQFAGQTLGSGSLVLLVVEMPTAEKEEAMAASSVEATLSVSCEKMVIGSMALSELRAWLLAA